MAVNRRLWVDFYAPNRRLFREAVRLLRRKGWRQKWSAEKLAFQEYRVDGDHIRWVEMTDPGENPEDSAELPLSKAEIRLYFGG